MREFQDRAKLTAATAAPRMSPRSWTPSALSSARCGSRPPAPPACRQRRRQTCRGRGICHLLGSRRRPAPADRTAHLAGARRPPRRAAPRNRPTAPCGLGAQRPRAPRTRVGRGETRDWSSPGPLFD